MGDEFHEMRSEDHRHHVLALLSFWGIGSEYPLAITWHVPAIASDWVATSADVMPADWTKTPQGQVFHRRRARRLA
jgi:hypothetical protein